MSNLAGQKSSLSLALVTASCLLLVFGACQMLPPFERYMKAGQEALSKNNFAEAEKNFRLAAVEAKKLKNGDQELTESLCEAGEAIARQNRNADARDFYERALSAQKKNLAANPERTVKILLRLAQLNFADNLNSTAEEFATEAVKEGEAKLSKDNKNLAYAQAALAEVKMGQRKFKQAAQLLQEVCRNLRVSSPGEAPAQIYKLATCLRELNDEQGAEDLEEEARMGQIGDIKARIKKMPI